MREKNKKTVKLLYLLDNIERELFWLRAKNFKIDELQYKRMHISRLGNIVLNTKLNHNSLANFYFRKLTEPINIKIMSITI